MQQDGSTMTIHTTQAFPSYKNNWIGLLFWFEVYKVD